MDNRTRFVFGLWHGGVNYSAPWSDDLEIFASVSNARSALVERAINGARFRQEFNYAACPEGFGRRTVLDLDQSVHTPNADEGAYMDVFITYAVRQSEALEKVLSGTVDYTRWEYTSGHNTRKA